MTIEAMKQALEALGEIEWSNNSQWQSDRAKVAITALRQAIEQAEQDPIGDAQDRLIAEQEQQVTVLPDGSAFAVMSWPLPKNHWLYADRQYNKGEYEPVELGKPILTHELRDAVVSAVRYAIRGATNCGKDVDFDPDALVQNAVYALCGPFGKAYTAPPPQRQPLPPQSPCEMTPAERKMFRLGWLECEAAHGIKGEA